MMVVTSRGWKGERGTPLTTQVSTSRCTGSKTRSINFSIYSPHCPMVSCRVGSLSEPRLGQVPYLMLPKTFFLLLHYLKSTFYDNS